MNNKSLLGLRICTLITVGLAGGTTFGIVSFHSIQNIAICGFTGAIAGLVAALIFSIPLPAWIQGPLSGIFVGFSVGILNLFTLSQGESPLKVVGAPIVGFAVGLTIFRFLNRKIPSELFARFHKSNKAQQGAAANP